MKGILYILIAALLWALDTLIRYPLLQQGMSPVKIVFFEHLILCLIFFNSIKKIITSWWSTKTLNHQNFPFLAFFIIGPIGSGLSTLAFTKAFSYINPSIVIILQKFQPLVVILLSKLYLKEKMKAHFLILLPISLLGGILVSYDDLIKLFEIKNLAITDHNIIIGHLLTIFAVIGWGTTTVFGKKLIIDGWGEKEIMGGRFLFGIMPLIPLLLLEGSFSAPPLELWPKFLVMVLMSGMLAMTFYYKGLKIVGAKLCSLLEMFFPFFSICVNWLFLDLSLSIVSIFGALILLASSTIIQYCDRSK